MQEIQPNKLNDFQPRSISEPKAGISLHGDNSPVKVSEAEKHQKMWNASQQFEAMFLNQLYKSMRETIHESEPTEESNGRAIFTEMLDYETAKRNALSDVGKPDENGKLPGSTNRLAALIYRSLQSRDENELGTLLQGARQANQPDLSAFKGVGLQSSLGNARYMDEDDLKPLIDKASQKYQLSPNLLMGVIKQESAGNPYAVSPKGAKGLMQLMDTTARDLGVTNSFDATQNVMGGAKYLRQMMDRFGGDEAKALAGYNAGPGAVEKYGGIPPYKETQDYVKKILGRRKTFDLMESQ